MIGLRYAASAAATVALSACGGGGASNSVKAGEPTSNAATAAAPAKAPASSPAAQQKPKDNRQAEANKDRRERQSRGVPRDEGDYDMPIDAYEPQDSEGEGSTDMPVDTYEPQG